LSISYCVCKQIIAFMTGHRITDVQFTTLVITICWHLHTQPSISSWITVLFSDKIYQWQLPSHGQIIPEEL